MLRIAIVSFLLVEGFLIAKAQENEATLLKDLFESDTEKNCSEIAGKASGCLDCYICDRDASNTQISRGKAVHRITFSLEDKDCQAQEYCCYSQRDSTAREMGYCGKSEPNGYPRSLRIRLRSVLQGQYPWRTWIFSLDSPQPLCAGVYINHDKRAVITSATCIANYFAEELKVGFTRDKGNIGVRTDFYSIHDDYSRDTQINDIAMIALSQEDTLPPWAHPACLPSYKPALATSCIAVSDQDLFVNSIILGQSSCVVNKTSLDQSVLCAISPIRNDYIPEVGGGLFCEKATKANNFNFVVYGIHLYKSDSLSVYTNISNHIDWIQNQVDIIET